MNLYDSSEVLRVRPRRKTFGESNLVPMINIVFLLLVFFMVAGQIQLQDGSDIQPPSSGTLDRASPPVADIHMDRHNEIYIDGKTLSIDQMSTVLTSDQYADVDQLLIKADRHVKAAELGVLLDALRSAGIGSIRLLTQQSGS